MRWQRRYWKMLCRLFGALLLLAGLVAAYWWFYKLGPARRMTDRDWVSSHSRQEYWREVQKEIHRGMSSHDNGLDVGRCGDKSWAQWIMEHVEPGKRMGGCFDSVMCHSDAAMQFIANQDAGPDVDDWLAWWEKNESKSQVEWIADGFAQRGIKVDMPPSAEQIPGVLALLGDSRTDLSTQVPDYVKYNAFRCLRDSGFNPVEFALSHGTLSAECKQGLLEYAKRYRYNPETIGLGILPLGKNDAREGGDSYLPLMATLRFRIAGYAIVFVPLALGAGLLVWSFRNKRRDTVS